MSAVPMEDTAMMSTSVSTVRTLHHDTAERLSQRVDQLSASSIVTDSAASFTIPASIHSTPSNTDDPMTSITSPPASPNLSPAHSAQHSPSFDSLSESSLPSVSSSFFFSSSAAGSPGRSRNGSYPNSEQEQDKDHHLQDTTGPPLGNNLVIPSLALPPALRQPTPFGQTLGDLRLLVLGAQGAGKSFLTGLLLEDNEDVVDVGTWKDWEEGVGAADPGGVASDSDVNGSFGYGKVLTASTDWLERRGSYGSERYEPARNVHIVELPGYSQDADATELITRLKNIVEAPFHALHNVLHPDASPSGMVSDLLTSPTSPLYTAMVFLLPSTPTPLELQIISDLSTHIPLIVLPRLHGPHRKLTISQSVIPSTLSTFRPSSAVALRSGLFHSPETVALLRGEAVDRFLRWREVEKSVEKILGVGKEQAGISRSKRRRLNRGEWVKPSIGSAEGDAMSAHAAQTPGEEKWDEANWEAEWLVNFSRDVDSARRKREATITQKDIIALPPQATGLVENPFASSAGSTNRRIEKVQTPAERSGSHSFAAVFDPLHFPSLLAFSFSLLGPLRTRLGQSIQGVWEAMNETQVKVALLGGFCIGFGVGSGLIAPR